MLSAIRERLQRRGIWPEAGLTNPCLGALPDHLARDERTQAIWQGLDPAQVWDSHAHLAGIGDGGSGVRMHRDLLNPLKLWRYLQGRFYLNSSCSNQAGRVDRAYVDRLLALHEEMPRGYKTVLLAFDDCYAEDGRCRSDISAMVTPNSYARQVARDYPTCFEWIASIHPYREDCVEELELAVATGARAVKWLPAAQGMVPSSTRCDRLYAAMAKYDIPLLCHAGAEKAVHGADRPDLGNPLLLRRPLEQGVRVIVAHCASVGSYPDLDGRGRGRERESFELFARMMDEPANEHLLYADISAITQNNRAGTPLRTVIARDEWHPRLINGTDYPLPGVMPLFSLYKLARAGYLDVGAVAWLNSVRRHNPLLFDFALKRSLRWQGKAISDCVFESRRLFAHVSLSRGKEIDRVGDDGGVSFGRPKVEQRHAGDH